MRQPIFVVTPRTVVRKEGNELVFLSGESKKRLPIGVIDSLFLFSGTEITSKALRFLLSNGRFVFFLSHFGKLVGVAVPEPLPSDNSLRSLQYSRFKDKGFKLELCRELLFQKLESVRRELQSLSSETSSPIPSLNEWELSIKVPIQNASEVSSFLGIDGTISKYLYDRLSSFNQSPFYFERRDYYPPQDPVNAVLSLSFTLFYSLLYPIVFSKGLDPYFGFFHVKRGKHSALCSDLLEVIRPQIARFFFTTFNDGFFSEGDFFKEKRGVRLKREALKAYLKFFYEETLLNDNYLQPAENFLNLIIWRLKRG